MPCLVDTIEVEVLFDERIYQVRVERLPSSTCLEGTPLGDDSEYRRFEFFVAVASVAAPGVARPNESSFEELDLIGEGIRQRLRIFVIRYYNTCGQ